MIVIADTSPINYLVLIDQINVLPKIYGEILIPQAVFDELLDSASPQKVREWLSTHPDWLRISDAVFSPDCLTFWIKGNGMQFSLQSPYALSD